MKNKLSKIIKEYNELQVFIKNNPQLPGDYREPLDEERCDIVMVIEEYEKALIFQIIDEYHQYIYDKAEEEHIFMQKGDFQKGWTHVEKNISPEIINALLNKKND